MDLLSQGSRLAVGVYTWPSSGRYTTDATQRVASATWCKLVDHPEDPCGPMVSLEENQIRDHVIYSRGTIGHENPMTREEELENKKSIQSNCRVKESL